MARTGQTYSLPAGTAAVTGAVVDSSKFNTLTDDIATALTGSLARAGGSMSGALAMGANKITGLAAGTASGEAVRYEQAAKLDVADQTITGGARVTSYDLGTISSGTTTLDPGDRPMQHATVTGNFTLAPGSNVGTLVLDITISGGSVTLITTSGFTKATGGFTYTNGHKFRCYASVGDAGSLLQIVAMQ